MTQCFGRLAITALILVLAVPSSSLATDGQDFRQIYSALVIESEGMPSGFEDSVYRSISDQASLCPELEERLRENNGAFITFHFKNRKYENLLRNQNDPNEDLMDLKEGGRGMELTVSSEDSKPEISWKHFMGLDVPRMANHRERTSEELRPRTDALLYSFFVEMCPKPQTIVHPRIMRIGRPSSEIPWEEKHRVALRFSLGKLAYHKGTNLPKIMHEWNESGELNEAYRVPLLDDISDYFDQNKLPDEIARMEITIFQTCIRNAFVAHIPSFIVNRRSPSICAPCIPGLDRSVLGFYVEAYDHQGLRILMQKNGASDVFFDEPGAIGGIIDTLHLPYNPGSFSAVMKRMLVEANDSLAAGVIPFIKPIPHSSGGIQY